MKYCICCLLICSLGINLRAQHIRGVVIDTSGVGIPFVKINIENTNTGTVSNLKGEFQLELPYGRYQLKFANIEFRDTVIGIDHQTFSTGIRVTMTTGTKDLKQLVIKASDKDPAYAIIKQAIKNRKKYLHQFDTYKFDTYTKCTVEKEYELLDTLTDSVRLTKDHLNLIESISTTYKRGINEIKQIVYAYINYSDERSEGGVQISYGPSDEGPPIGGDYNPYIYQEGTTGEGFNFYENLISHPGLNSTPYTSPIASTALLTYNYHLEDTWMVNERIVYKIKVWPKLKISSTFSGTIFIEEGSFALTGVDLEINPRTLYNYKSLYVNHKYDIYEDTLRILKEENYHYLKKESGDKIFGTTIKKHSNYEINPEIEKNFFKNELKIVQDDAYEKDSAYWADHREISLQKKEMEFISYQDSLEDHYNSVAYKDKQDSITNRLKFLDFILYGVGFTNWRKKREIFFDPLISQLRPLGVGGYRHVIGINYDKEWESGYALDLRLEADYGFNNQDLKGGMDVRVTYNPKRFSKIHFAISDGYRILNSYESITAYFSRSNYIRTKGVTVGHSLELFNGLYMNLDVEYYDNLPIDNLQLSDWSEKLFGELNEPERFDPFTELYLDLELTYTFKQKYYTLPHKKVILGSKYPVLTLHYKRGIDKLLGSVVDFNFMELHAHDDFTIGTFGTSKWDIHVGEFITNDNIMLTDNKFFRGSDKYFFSNPLRSFQLIGPSVRTTNAYLQGNYIHHFNGAIMNKIPLINRLKLQSVGGAGILMIEDNNFQHAEFFIGLEKPFRLFKEMFKAGIYFVTADSNHSDLNTQFKIGIDFFNPFTKAWSY